jgi:TRAP-type C4-dicarboxylate transport system permease large subunit
VHAPPTRTRTLLSTIPVFILLVSALCFDLAGRMNARMMEVGQSMWDGYALLRTEPAKPECDPASFKVPEPSSAPGSAAAAGGDDDLLAGLDEAGGDKPVKDAISGEAVLAAKRKCEEQHALYNQSLAQITPGLRSFDGFHDTLEAVVVWGNGLVKGLLICLLMFCSITASAMQAHIGLRNAASSLDHRVSEGVQAVASALLFHSVFAQWQIDRDSGTMATNSVLFYVWMTGFGLMFLTHVFNLIRPPAGLKPGGSLHHASLAIPLYAFMTLVAGAYFLLVEHHAPGLAIYTQQMAEHPLLYIPVGLYVWIGMLLKQTSIGPLGFDVLRPWRLPPELLAFVVVAFAAWPTAYSGASGIFVMAVGGLIYTELRRAGARRQLALAATAMSGSLGVVLRPCLLVVIVASLNREVTTDELYGWGVWVYLGTATMFLVASLVVRRLTAGAGVSMGIAPFGEGFSGMLENLRPMAGYLILAVLVVGFYRFGLGTSVDEHTAPTVLPVVMLVLLAYDRWRARKLEAGDRPKKFSTAALDATCETSGHIGALLIMMACSVAIGGIVERSEVMSLVPETFGSTFATMGLLVAILVVVGMTMDPYGAVILVSASFAQVAYRNGIEPAHFWMTVLVAFELGYLTPPVALNQLLARQVVGEDEWEAARAEGKTFWQRNESVILPCAIMGVALLIVAFVPLAFY